MHLRRPDPVPSAAGQGEGCRTGRRPADRLGSAGGCRRGEVTFASAAPTLPRMCGDFIIDNPIPCFPLPAEENAQTGTHRSGLIWRQRVTGLGLASALRSRSAPNASAIASPARSTPRCPRSPTSPKRLDLVPAGLAPASLAPAPAGLAPAGLRLRSISAPRASAIASPARSTPHWPTSVPMRAPQTVTLTSRCTRAPHELPGVRTRTSEEHEQQQGKKEAEAKSRGTAADGRRGRGGRRLRERRGRRRGGQLDRTEISRLKYI